MPSISLTQPTALTVITAGLHATNYNALSSLLNGGLDNANIAAGANINPTKLLLPGGTTTFLRGDGSFAAVPVTVPFGTSLPGSPVDGEEYILVDSATAPTYAWHFRYASGISDANKWVFVGGSPAFVVVDAAQATTSTTYAALSTAGPSFTVPRAGQYLVAVWSKVSISGGSGVCSHSYDIGGTGAIDNDASTMVIQSGNTELMPTQERLQASLAASTTLVSKYKSNAGFTATFSLRTMSVLPVRVA